MNTYQSCPESAVAVRGGFGGATGRLVVVSNRLPIRVEEHRGGMVLRRATGGLVTALEPVLEESGGAWVGWDDGELGSESARQLANDASLPYRLWPVDLEPDLADDYYLGFSNETLWPLFHDMLGRAQFHRHTWRAYEVANRIFAERVVEETGPGDVVWVQDYHLGLVGREVRNRADRALAWFLHTPFPPLDIFAHLPWRRQYLEALLQYDLVGFQTRRDMRNFLGCAKALLTGVQIEGSGAASCRQIVYRDRVVSAGFFPISIDYRAFDAISRTPAATATADRIHAALPGGRHVLGVDRLDYTKGLPQRFRAFETFLERHPEHRGRVTLVQLAVPSRQRVDEYRQLREEVEREVGRINGRFARIDWTPILYFHGHLSREELLGYYRAAEIALVTPLKDGMNLVAKEYCASSVDEEGVLILSEFAGAAIQLGSSALLVNPSDRDGTAEAIRRAVEMSPEERRSRMSNLRRHLRRHDVAAWVGKVSDALRAALRGDAVS